jgi:hypothetical protein
MKGITAKGKKVEQPKNPSTLTIKRVSDLYRFMCGESIEGVSSADVAGLNFPGPKAFYRFLEMNRAAFHDMTTEAE